MRGEISRGLLVLLLLLTVGCSVKKMAINSMSDTLADSGTAFSKDDDPEFIKQASPFSLKLMESLLEANPNHKGLLLASCKGFTQYSYAFIQQDADELETKDLQTSLALRTRARRMYLRARNYGLRGLEVAYPGIEKRLHENAKAAVQEVKLDDVGLLFWTAASWGAAISVSKDDPETIADQPIVEAMVDRALQLDPKFDNGTVYGFLIAYESARQGAKGDWKARSKDYFNRAVEASKGRLASPYVAYAENVCVAAQNRKEFEDLLNKALAVDADAIPEWRMANLVVQRRAKWLLGRTDELFVE